MMLLVFAGLLAGGGALLFYGLTPAALLVAGSATGRAWRTRAEEFLRHAGLDDVSVRDFALVSLASGVLAGVAAQVLLGWPAVSAAAAALGLLGPLGYYGPRRDRRRAAIQVALVEATAQLRAAIQAGLSIQQAPVELAPTRPQPLRPQLARL